MILKRLFLAFACTMFITIEQSHASIVLNFDDVATNETVDGFYNGGTSSDSLTGPNLGVDFQAGDWFTETGFGETTSPNFAFSDSGSGVVNVAAGFGTFAFTFGAFSDTTVNVWSETDGTGTLLGSFLATKNQPDVAPFVAFEAANVNFSGTAKSISIATGNAQFGWDNLQFGPATAVPEPTSLCLCGVALVGVYLASRKKILNRKA